MHPWSLAATEKLSVRVYSCSVFKDEWDQKHGTGAWDEKLRAAWDAVFDDSVANSPCVARSASARYRP